MNPLDLLFALRSEIQAGSTAAARSGGFHIWLDPDSAWSAPLTNSNALVASGAGAHAEFATLSNGTLRLNGRVTTRIQGACPQWHQVFDVGAEQHTLILAAPALLTPGVLEWVRDESVPLSYLRANARLGNGNPAQWKALWSQGVPEAEIFPLPEGADLGFWVQRARREFAPVAS